MNLLCGSRTAYELTTSPHSEQNEKERIMKSGANGLHHCEEARFPRKARPWIRQVIHFGLILFLSTAAHAQYGGAMGTPASPGTYTPGSKSYGTGKAIGIGVGAAAVGAGAIYFMTHRSSKVTGCVQTADDGLHLTDDKTNRTLAIVPGKSDVRPGERLELKGKIKKNEAGEQNFLVKSVAKDLGSCSARASAASEHSAAAAAR
jgi:hypothetical protein